MASQLYIQNRFSTWPLVITSSLVQTPHLSLDFLSSFLTGIPVSALGHLLHTPHSNQSKRVKTKTHTTLLIQWLFIRLRIKVKILTVSCKVYMTSHPLPLSPQAPSHQLSPFWPATLLLACLAPLTMVSLLTSQESSQLKGLALALSPVCFSPRHPSDFLSHVLLFFAQIAPSHWAPSPALRISFPWLLFSLTLTTTRHHYILLIYVFILCLPKLEHKSSWEKEFSLCCSLLHF